MKKLFALLLLSGLPSCSDNPARATKEYTVHRYVSPKLGALRLADLDNDEGVDCVLFEPRVSHSSNIMVYISEKFPRDENKFAFVYNPSSTSVMEPDLNSAFDKIFKSIDKAERKIGD